MKTQLLGLAIAIGLLVGLIVWAAAVFFVGAISGWIPATLIALLLPVIPPYLLRLYWAAKDSQLR